jgi:hypothetical protein
MLKEIEGEGAVEWGSCKSGKGMYICVLCVCVWETWEMSDTQQRR